jgi:hypothetical protein
LLVERQQDLFEHSAVGGGGGPTEIFGSPGASKFQCPALVAP